MALQPITRAEQIMSGESLIPITREEMFLAKAAGQDVQTPTPITRREMFLSKIAEGGGSGGSGSEEEWFNDGDTHIWITLQEGRTSPMLGVCPNGTVTVDWGDGTEPDVLTGTSTTDVKWTPTHEYTAPGDYVIALTVEGTMGFYGESNSNQYSGILRYSSGADTRNLAYQNAVQKVEIGEGVTSIGSNAFYSCPGMRYYDFTACTSVPALQNKTAFNGIPADCEIRVPAALYDEWIAATNWSTYASQIVAV